MPTDGGEPMATSSLDRVLNQFRGSTAGDAELLGRYTANGDEAAFEALVRRHGPMVLGVCRRVLRNEADAHDAFQATFLVLVRRAGHIRQPGRVACWLYGVARRVAAKARVAADRRRTYELASGGRQPPEAEHVDLADTLDAELARLPTAYRQAVLMCDLEGRTIRETAETLGWPVGTVATRLTRGRARLAQRLLAQGYGPAAVPAVLVAATVRAAGSAGAVPAAERLANEVLRAMFIKRMQVGLGVVVAAGALLAGVTLSAAQADNPVAVAQKKEAGKADPSPIDPVKGLEAGVWYPYRVDREGRTMDVSDTPQHGMHWGAAAEPNFERLIGLHPTGSIVFKGLTVADDAAVTIDGKPAKLGDLPGGSHVRLKFGGRLTVTAIDAKSPPVAFWPVIQAVDVDKRTVVVQLADRAAVTELPVAPDAAITDRLGRKLPLADLSAGTKVSLVMGVRDGRPVVNSIGAWKN